MKKQILVALLLTTILAAAPTKAKAEEITTSDDKIIVTITATKTERSADEVPTAMTVITSDEIEQKKASTVAELLRTVPGLQVVANGGTGKVTSIFIRGANSDQVLVLVDGVQLNSPTLGGFDLGTFSTANIEKITILKGTQSTLYGSNASAGVINIITKKGSDYSQSYLSVETGSFNTQKTSANILGSSGKKNYSLGVATTDTNGISSRKAPIGEHYERDGFENTTINGRFGYNFTDKTKLDLTFYHNISQNDLDDFSGDTIFYSSENRTAIGSAKVSQELREFYDYTLKYSYVDTESVNLDLTTLSNSSEIYTNIETVDFQNNFTVDDNILTIGAEYEEQSGKNESSQINHSIVNKSIFGQGQLFTENNFNVLLSARQDDHELFGTHSTYNTGVTYKVKSTDTTVKANYGTGFKAPTLNDLFFYSYYSSPGYVSTSFGNEKLLPEESKSFDLTIEQKIGNRGSLSVTYFKSEFKNLIGWTSNIISFGPPFEDEWFPVNTNQAESKGFELGASFNLNDNMSLNGNYTTQEPIDKLTKKYLPKRALRHGSASMNANYANLNVILTGRYVGKRYADSANTTVLKRYTTGDLTVNYDVDDKLTIFGKVTNINDKEYVEADGFGVEPIGYFGGVKVSF